MTWAVALLSLAMPAAAFRLKHNRTDPDCFEPNPCPEVPAYVDPCACLSFKEVYDSNSAICGDGKELNPSLDKSALLTKELAMQYMGVGLCTEFYSHVDDNKCTNINFEGSGDAWCYTSVGCKEASMVKTSYKMHAKVKKCGKTDVKLGSLSPPELKTWVHKHDVDFGMAGKLAYKVKHSMTWSKFKEDVLITLCPVAKSKPERLPLQAERERNLELEEVLKTTVLDNKYDPICLTDVGDNSKYGIVSKTTVFEVTAVDPSKADHKHPETETFVTVLCGDGK